MKVKIVGIDKSTSSNKDTGEIKVYTVLYYVYQRPIKQVSNNRPQGFKTGQIKTNMNVDVIEIDKIYDLEIETKEYQGRTYKVLEDYELIKNS